MKPQHTPTPWKIDEGNQTISGPGRKNQILSVLDDMCPELTVYDRNENESFENLKFIVRAVNSHEALLKLVKDFIERIVTCPDCRGSGMENKYSACPRCGGQGKVMESATTLISDFNEVIAQAEGK